MAKAAVVSPPDGDWVGKSSVKVRCLAVDQKLTESAPWCRGLGLRLAHAGLWAVRVSLVAALSGIWSRLRSAQTTGPQSSWKGRSGVFDKGFGRVATLVAAGMATRYNAFLGGLRLRKRPQLRTSSEALRARYTRGAQLCAPTPVARPSGPVATCHQLVTCGHRAQASGPQ